MRGGSGHVREQHSACRGGVWRALDRCRAADAAAPLGTAAARRPRHGRQQRARAGVGGMLLRAALRAPAGRVGPHKHLQPGGASAAAGRSRLRPGRASGRPHHAAGTARRRLAGASAADSAAAGDERYGRAAADRTDRRWPARTAATLTLGCSGTAAAACSVVALDVLVLGEAEDASVAVVVASVCRGPLPEQPPPPPPHGRLEFFCWPLRRGARYEPRDAPTAGERRRRRERASARIAAAPCRRACCAADNLAPRSSSSRSAARSGGLPAAPSDAHHVRPPRAGAAWRRSRPAVYARVPCCPPRDSAAVRGARGRSSSHPTAAHAAFVLLGGSDAAVHVFRVVRPRRGRGARSGTARRSSHACRPQESERSAVRAREVAPTTLVPTIPVPPALPANPLYIGARWLASAGGLLVAIGCQDGTLVVSGTTGRPATHCSARFDGPVGALAIFSQPQPAGQPQQPQHLIAAAAHGEAVVFRYARAPPAARSRSLRSPPPPPPLP